MDAVKKVIASMTVGKDVSMLFTDVLNCVQTGNIELKKLVYLYLINYAKSQPELTLLAVNTFCQGRVRSQSLDPRSSRPYHGLYSRRSDDYGILVRTARTRSPRR